MLKPTEPFGAPGDQVNVRVLSRLTLKRRCRQRMSF